MILSGVFVPDEVAAPLDPMIADALQRKFAREVTGHPFGADGGSRLRPADHWTFPDWSALWHCDYLGLLTEAD